MRSGEPVRWKTRIGNTTWVTAVPVTLIACAAKKRRNAPSERRLDATPTACPQRLAPRSPRGVRPSDQPSTSSRRPASAARRSFSSLEAGLGARRRRSPPRRARAPRGGRVCRRGSRRVRRRRGRTRRTRSTPSRSLPAAASVMSTTGLPIATVCSTSTRTSTRGTPVRECDDDVGVGEREELVGERHSGVRQRDARVADAVAEKFARTSAKHADGPTPRQAIRPPAAQERDRVFEQLRAARAWRARRVPRDGWRCCGPAAGRPACRRACGAVARSGRARARAPRARAGARRARGIPAPWRFARRSRR